MLSHDILQVHMRSILSGGFSLKKMPFLGEATAISIGEILHGRLQG